SGTAGLAGSANVTLRSSDTEASVGAQTTVTAAGDGTIQAEDTLQSIAVPGATAAGGKFGVGGAVGARIIEPTVRAFLGESAQVTAAGDVQITAVAHETVFSLAASLAVGLEKFGLAGSGSSQNVRADVDAFVAPHAVVTTDGNVLVAAND